MPRVRSRVSAHRRHKKVLRRARGYEGARSRTFRAAQQAVLRAGQYAYRDRRQKRRFLRRLWITRINAQARSSGLNYSRFMLGLKKAGILLDRKMLAHLAVQDEAAFAALLEKARAALH